MKKPTQNKTKIDTRAFVSQEDPKNKKSTQIKIRTNYKCIKSFEAHDDWVEKVKLLSNGKLITCSQDNSIKLWDLTKDDNKPNLVFEGHEEAVMDIIEFSKDKIITTSKDRTIRKWNINTGKELFCYNDHQPIYCCIKINDELIAIGGSDKSIKILDFSKDNLKEEEIEEIEKAKLEGHTEDITDLVLKDENTLISSSMDKTIKIWNLKEKICISTLSDHSMGVKCLKLLNDGKLASGSFDDTIKIWDLKKYNCWKTLKGHHGHIFSLAQLPDGRLISGATDWSMIIWNLEKGASEIVLEGHEEAVYSIDIFPDGKIVSGSIDQNVKIWD